ncbi:MAG: penicillin-binding protein 2 [Elusimicrobia bacterium]|nr:penicillin-binding protein 2 [Elusimicrobiota bacterium]
MDGARLHGLAAAILFSFLVLTLRLLHLQILQHPKLASLTTQQLKRQSELPSQRAAILDRNGHVLARSIPAWSCYAHPEKIRDKKSVAYLLADLLQKDASSILQTLQEKKPFVWIARDVDYPSAERLQKLRIAGIEWMPQVRRVHPNGRLAQNLLGQVGMDGYGLSGVEQRFNKILQGKGGKRKFFLDANGKSIYLEAQEPDPEPPELVLTMDRNIQYTAEKMLQRQLEKFQAAGGEVLIQDPKSGEILAMAHLPSNPLQNPPTQLAYEPGSTFKTITLAAALEERRIGLDDHFFCENGLWAATPSLTLRDPDPHGRLSVADIVGKSSNICMAKIAERLGKEKLYWYVRAFGFGNKTAIPLPGESPGVLRVPSAWSQVSLYTLSFGQEVGVTSIQLLSAYSAIANGGVLLEPQLLRGQADPGGNLPGPLPPRPVRRVLSKKTALEIAKLLEGVVQEGTGTKAQVAGYRVAGKTGTAQKFDSRSNGYSPERFVASFCGFFPVSDPRFTVLVVLDEPQGSIWGSQVAAPLFSEIASYLATSQAIPADREWVSRGQKRASHAAEKVD